MSLVETSYLHWAGRLCLLLQEMTAPTPIAVMSWSSPALPASCWVCVVVSCGVAALTDSGAALAIYGKAVIEQLWFAAAASCGCRRTPNFFRKHAFHGLLGDSMDHQLRDQFASDLVGDLVAKMKVLLTPRVGGAWDDLCGKTDLALSQFPRGKVVIQQG
jgi:hypothetical protein